MNLRCWICFLKATMAMDRIDRIDPMDQDGTRVAGVLGPAASQGVGTGSMIRTRMVVVDGVWEQSPCGLVSHPWASSEL